jgi:hypothetical protein
MRGDRMKARRAATQRFKNLPSRDQKNHDKARNDKPVRQRADSTGVQRWRRYKQPPHGTRRGFLGKHRPNVHRLILQRALTE